MVVLWCIDSSAIRGMCVNDNGMVILCAGVDRDIEWRMNDGKRKAEGWRGKMVISYVPDSDVALNSIVS